MSARLPALTDEQADSLVRLWGDESYAAILPQIADAACALALKVARGEMTQSLASRLLTSRRQSRALLDRWCDPGCGVKRIPDSRRPERMVWSRVCVCGAGAWVQRHLQSEVTQWEDAIACLDRLIRKRLAPVIARGGSEAEMGAVCRAADWAGILTPEWRRAIAEEEAAWWVRLNATLTAEERRAA